MVTCGNFMVQAYIYSTKEVFHTGEGNFEKSVKGWYRRIYPVVKRDKSDPAELGWTQDLKETRTEVWSRLYPK